eukprot:scaffold4939_cov95-Skeletonema_dohrnii-CCMP3373.AAC.3
MTCIVSRRSNARNHDSRSCHDTQLSQGHSNVPGTLRDTGDIRVSLGQSNVPRDTRMSLGQSNVPECP